MSEEEETLKLISKVEDEFTEPLERLEQALEDVDDAIRDSGKGRNDVTIDTDVRGASTAIGELEALETAVDTLDDETVLIDADVQEGSFDQLFDEREAETTVDDEVNVFDAPSEMPSPAEVMEDVESPSVDEQSVLGPEIPTNEGPVADPNVATSGGRDHDLFTVENMSLFEDEMDPFLDTQELGRRGGEVSRVEDILDRDITELVDFEVAVERVGDDDSAIDINTLKGIKGLDGPEAFADAVETLSAEGLTDLGTGRLSRRKRLREVMTDMVFTMGKFHQIIASLIPLAGVLVGALPAAITGVVALGGAALAAAGALGAIGALGAMGMNLKANGEMGLEALAEELDAIGQTFADAFAPLSRSLAPTLETALTSIEDMAGPLANASSGLLAFRDEFVGVASFIERTLPSLVSEVIAFGHAITPIISGLVNQIGDKDTIGFFAAQLEQALPSLIMLFNSVIEILPAIVRLSQGFLTVTAVIGLMAESLALVLNTFPVFTRGLGILVSMFLVATSAVTLWSAAMTGASGTILSYVIPSVIAAVEALTGYTLTTWQAYAATTALIGALTLGAGALASFAGEFSLLGGNVKDARKELEKFNRTGNALGSTSIRGNGGENPYATTAGGSTTVINAGDRDSAARQQYASQYEQQQHVDSVFSR
jgi:hypothetical protein